MTKEVMLVRLACQQEIADQVAAALPQLFQSFDQSPAIAVTNVLPGQGRRTIVIDTGRLYTDEDAIDIFSEPGYDALLEYPGVLSAEAVSSLADRPTAMTELEANSLAEQIMKDASWLQRVTVRPAHEVNDDFTSDERAFVCWIEGRQFCAEIYNAIEWGQLFERLDYENRMNEFSMQTDEPDVRPFHRYVVDAPTLPNSGTYGYISLERHAVRNFLLASNMPPWRSAVRTLGGVKTIHALSKVRVPVSVATFAMHVGDQALVVTPSGDIGLLVREK